MNYRQSSCCGECRFYIPAEAEESGTCQIAAGTIDPDDLCNQYRPLM